MNKPLIWLAVIAGLLFSFLACYKISGSSQMDKYLPFLSTSNSGDNYEQKINSNLSTLANPASEFCLQAGGALQKVSSPQGESNNCAFPNGEKCDEWSLWRGECNISGISNTGVYLNGQHEVKVIYRIFNNTALLNAPDLNLNNIELKSAISASGARYLSADEKVEFWEHQGEGALSLLGKEVFKGPLKK